MPGSSASMAEVPYPSVDSVDTIRAIGNVAGTWRSSCEYLCRLIAVVRSRKVHTLI
jgi:hypothetical protein